MTVGGDGEGDGLPFDSPPPVTVHGERSLELTPYTFCFDNGCADGMPPERPRSVGSPDHVVVEFPLDGWSFQATFQPASDRCGRTQTVPVEQTGDGSFTLEPAGKAGTYDVTLFGRGGGDLFVAFRWTTTEDGPLPEPEAELAVLADNDGEVDSYGVEMSLSNLADTPDAVSATVTVTSSDGDSLTFRPRRTKARCLPEGTVAWHGPHRAGKKSSGLGAPPFTYEVVVTLDGKRHTAMAEWPGDVITGYEPFVALEFTPALPKLR